MGKEIDWPKEIAAINGRCSTDELVKYVAAYHKITQAECKKSLEKFLPFAFSKGIGRERTSEVFLSRWERYRMPMYNNEYISYVYMLSNV